MTRQIVLWIWALVALALVGCQGAALAGWVDTAGTGGVLSFLTATRWRMVAGFVAWMWIGWHFFAR